MASSMAIKCRLYCKILKSSYISFGIAYEYYWWEETGLGGWKPCGSLDLLKIVMNLIRLIKLLISPFSFAERITKHCAPPSSRRPTLPSATGNPHLVGLCLRTKSRTRLHTFVYRALVVVNGQAKVRRNIRGRKRLGYMHMPTHRVSFRPSWFGTCLYKIWGVVPVHSNFPGNPHTSANWISGAFAKPVAIKFGLDLGLIIRVIGLCNEQRMRLPRRVPWSSTAELEALCSWIYTDENDLESKFLAINRVSPCT